MQLEDLLALPWVPADCPPDRLTSGGTDTARPILCDEDDTIRVEFGQLSRDRKWMYTSLSAPAELSPVKGRVIAFLNPLSRALRRMDDELRRRMGRKPHSAHPSMTEVGFYFRDPHDAPCPQADALLKLPWRAATDLPHAPPVRVLIFLSGAPGAYDPDIFLGECQSPGSWTIAAYGAARASALRISSPLAYLCLEDWPVGALAAALRARHVPTAQVQYPRTITNT